MSDKTDAMEAGEFAEWWGVGKPPNDLSRALASRDAYRARVALEAAAERGKDHILRNRSETCTCYEGLVAAILGAEGFVKGQLVRLMSHGVLRAWGERAAGTDPAKYEPVKAHVDEAGRVIVDEEA